eukprot:scaffold12617_cov91-Cylindrotheca_fusiformis.AAC.2
MVIQENAEVCHQDSPISNEEKTRKPRDDSSSSVDSHHASRRRRSRKGRSKKHKRRREDEHSTKKRRRRRSNSSDDPSNGSDDESSSVSRRRRRKHKKRKKKSRSSKSTKDKRREKNHASTFLQANHNDDIAEDRTQGHPSNAIASSTPVEQRKEMPTDGLAVHNDEDSKRQEAPRRMVPMSKEEYEKEQSRIRQVYDPESGRYRMVRGTGEIIESIVSRADHLRINQQATRGDGASFSRNTMFAARRTF